MSLWCLRQVNSIVEETTSQTLSNSRAMTPGKRKRTQSRSLIGSATCRTTQIFAPQLCFRTVRNIHQAIKEEQRAFQSDSYLIVWLFPWVSFIVRWPSIQLRKMSLLSVKVILKRQGWSMLQRAAYHTTRQQSGAHLMIADWHLIHMGVCLIIDVSWQTWIEILAQLATK